MRTMSRGSLLVAALMGSWASAAAGACAIQGVGAVKPRDVLAEVLGSESTCPRDGRELRRILQDRGAKLQPTMVSNRGFHNPDQGSFSLFETVTGKIAGTGLTVGEGEFFFGHFTEPKEGDALGLSQDPTDPRRASLMVELIVWDEAKGYYNFYELIGNKTQRAWAYRGDSRDILRDVQFLHRERGPAQTAFGQTLRCSGCHLAGGPIMKELDRPHNDWWSTKRGLDLGPWQPNDELAAIMADLKDADFLAANVKTGMAKLAASAAYREVVEGLSLQERLRPLFCPVELNLASDGTPLADASEVHAPLGFLVDQRLAAQSITVDKAAYVAALERRASRFPETGGLDADHAWLAPVKAASDRQATQALIAGGTITAEFAADVLAVDFTRPVFSPERCGLLTLVPDEDEGWLAQFKTNLGASGSPPAKALLANLNDAARTAAFHAEKARSFVATCQARASDAAGLDDLIGMLGLVRAEAFASEISTAEQGQILEPGFRVIFPALDNIPTPGSARLDERCRLTRLP